MSQPTTKAPPHHDDTRLTSPKVHHFPTEPFNWYVIEDAGRLTLVDAGFPGHYRAFRTGIESLGRSVKDVESIVLTHAHADHTGFASRVSREADVPVYIHDDDAAKARKILQLPWPALVSNAWCPWGSHMLLSAVRAGIFTCPRVRDVVAVRDDQLLDIPGRPRVIHTPGHTPGHISLLLEPQRVLIAGDAMLTLSLKTGRTHTPRVPESPYNMNTDRAKQSADRLRQLGHITVLPGHGESWDGDLGALELY